MGLSNTSKNNAAAAGEYGSVFTDTTDALIAPSGSYFFSITVIEKCKFNSSGGLVATDSSKYINTEAAASAGGSGGAQLDDSTIFPAGITIFGQWTQIKILTGASIMAQLAS